MAIRIQLRHDTSANWELNNPTLREGEFGIETDTLKIKVGPVPVSGDATAWSSITNYVNIVPSDFNNIINGYVEATDIGASGGVVGLNNDKNAIIPGSSIIIEGPTNNAYETTLTVVDPTADRTITLPNAEGTIALTTDIPSTTDGLSEGSTNKYFTDERAQDAVATALAAGTHTNITVGYNDSSNAISLTGAVTYTDENAQDAVGNAVGTGLSYNDTTGAISVDTSTIQARVADVSDTEIGYLNGVTSAIQTQLDAKAASSTAVTLTGTQTLTNKTLTSPTITIPSSTTTLYSATAGQVFAVSNSVDEPTYISLPDDQITALGWSLDPAVYAGKTLVISGADNAAYNASYPIQSAGYFPNSDEMRFFSTLVATKPYGQIGYPAISIRETISEKTISATEIGYVDGVTSAIQTQIDAKAPIASPTFTGTVTLPGAPTSDLHAATKAYVDASTSGLNVHDSVKAATTENVNLNNQVEAGDTLDGVTLTHNDRILVKNQTQAHDNGIYIVQLNGAATRATDYNVVGEVDAGDFIFVEGGTVNGKTGWIQTNKITTLGSDAIAFTQFSGAGTYSASNGLTLTGNAFSINTGVTADLTTAQTLTNKTLTSPKINEDVAVTATATEINVLDGITSSTAELNILDGATLSTTELNYVDGVTSAIQTQLNAKQAIVSGVSDTEIGYLDGVTSSIQTQLNEKLSTSGGTVNGNLTVGNVTSQVNKYIAVSGDKVVTSDDAITWSSVSSANAMAIAFGQGRVVGVGQGSNGVISYSSDGNTWTVANTPISGLWNDIAYGNGKFIAIGELNSRAVQSSDGITWTELTIPNIGANRQKIFTDGAGKWVVASTDNTFAYSTNNGTSWSTATLSPRITDGVFGNGYFYARSGDFIKRTQDFTNWTNSTFAIQNAYGGILFDGTKVIALETNGATYPKIWTTTGTEWVEDWPATNMGPTYSASYFGGKYLASGDDKVYYSSDAKSWTAVTKTESSTIYWQDIAGGSLTVTAPAQLSTNHLTVGDVSNTEIGYLNGVTSSIQTQLDAKIAKSLVDAKGDILVGSANDTVTRLGVGTNGYLLTANSSATNGVEWAAAPVSLPTQTDNAGKYLTTDGSTASWASLVVPITTGTATITQNTATTIDTNALSGFTSIEYMVSLKQGSKIRTSKVIVQTDGTSVDMTEFAITETGGTIAGIVISAAVSSTNAVLQVTATDAATTNVTVKFSEIKL